jgi:hypothetical protein
VCLRAYGQTRRIRCYVGPDAGHKLKPHMDGDTEPCSSWEMPAYWKGTLVPCGINDTSAKAVLENPLPRYIDMLSRHHDATQLLCRAPG